MSALQQRSDHQAVVPMFVAGFGLLLVALLAGWANFGVLEHRIVSGNSLATASNLTAGENMFRFGILAFILVAVLDVIVAWALHQVLRGKSPALSELAAVLRYVYAGILLLSTGFLALAASLVSRSGSADEVNLVVMQASLDAFVIMWDVGLLVFGCHLLVLGWVLWRSKVQFVWAGLGWFAAIAGAAYLFEAIAVVLDADPAIEVAMFSFIGEFVLLVGLIWAGFRHLENRGLSKERSGRFA